MRFFYLSLLLLGLITVSEAQNNFVPVKYNLEFQEESVSKTPEMKSIKNPGEVIWSEDFDSITWSATSNNGTAQPANAPAGWEIGDLTGNGFYFRWSAIGPRGIFTSPNWQCNVPSNAMNSTTGDNGYMMIEADYYNSASDCSEYYSDQMDSYIEYNAGIDFSGYNAVHLVFEQMNRFCCNYGPYSDAWFMVSADNGTTWTKYSVSFSEINDAIGNGSYAYNTELDISMDVSNESNVIFRFYLNGITHYHWEIDDVSFISPVGNDMRINDYWNDYLTYRNGSNGLSLSSSNDFTEGYYEYPWFIIQHYKGFHAAYSNFGYNTQTNVKHNVDIYLNDYILQSFASESIGMVEPGAIDTTHFEAGWMPNSIGEYIFKHYFSSDQSDDFTDNDTITRTLKIGESLISTVDFNSVNDEIAPSDWSSYDENGDGLGFFVNIPNPSLHQNSEAGYYRLNGVHIYIGQNSGIELPLFSDEVAKAVASVYKYDSIQETFTEIISSAEYTFTIDDTSSVFYIPFALDGTSEYVFQEQELLVAVNMYGYYLDNFNRLKSWKLKACNNEVQKNSSESFALVNASISTINDIQIIRGAPAIALDMWYSNEPASTVSFKVKDDFGTNIINANVDVEGYSSQSTNYNGTATFSDIPDGSTIYYNVSKYGYYSVYDSIESIVLGTTYNVTLIKKSYEVTLNVSDGTNPLVGALVDCDGFTNQYVNEQGFVTLSPVYWDVSYNYTVTYLNFPSETGILFEIISDTTFNIIIDTTTFKATFSITDGENPIENAQVYLENEETKYTDANGMAVFNGLVSNPNNRYYSVSANDYYSEQGYISVINEDVIEEVSLMPDTLRYKIIFEVNNGSLPISGAEILIYGDTTLITNSQGIAVYNDIIPESDITYFVSALSYYGQTGTIYSITDDVTESITLIENPATYGVTFHLSDGTNPVVGASVSMVNHGIVEANEQGIANFNSISPELDIFYIITADGYQQIRDYVSVIDHSVHIYIDYSTIGIKDHEVDVKLYPNPTNGQFIIDTDGQYHVSIVNITGKVIFETVNENQTTIDLSDQPSGIYYVNIIQNSKITTRQVVVQ